MFFNLKKIRDVYLNGEYSNSYKKLFTQTGLSYDSKKEIINENAEPIRWLASKGMISASDFGFLDLNGNLVDLKKEKSDSAIVYVHGFRGAPRNTPFSAKMFEFLKTRGCDIYAPLLLFHETNLKPFKYNPYLVFEKLKKDFEFLLSLGYKHLHFVVFSHGGLQTIKASIEGILDERCTLILLCPQLMSRKKMTIVKRGLFLAAHVFTRDFFKFEDEVLKKLSNSCIRNDFAYILAKGDVYVSYEVEPLLRAQKRCIKGIILEDAGHFVTRDPNFFGILDDYLETVL